MRKRSSISHSPPRGTFHRGGIFQNFKTLYVWRYKKLSRSWAAAVQLHAQRSKQIHLQSCNYARDPAFDSTLVAPHATM
eukprot:jgi/Mesvir1/8935/Mv26124-RA.1